MNYKSILKEIEGYESLSVIKIDRDRIMNSLGIDLENNQFINLSGLQIEELNDLIMKSLTWMERINEVQSTAKKIYMDLSLDADTLFNRLLRDSDTKKVTDAKAEAKTNPEYVNHQKRVNLLDAYVDYLERFSKNLEKIHYAVKGRLESLKGLEKKHYSS